MNNVTSVLMGDPPAGRSANDAMNVSSDATGSLPKASAPIGLSKPAPSSPTGTPAHGSEEMGPAPSPTMSEMVDAWEAARADRMPANLPDLPEPSTATTLRPVAAMEMEGVEPHAPPTGEPIFEHVFPADLMVEEAYQRGLTDKSLRLIRKIVAEWDWRKFKPPVVAFADGGLQIIDGQHTAIAAASNPHIGKIPVMIVEAPEMATRAMAFIGHNRDRLAVSPVQIHHAGVAAGDVVAATVERVCRRARVNIVRSSHGGYKWKVGDTIAVGAIKDLITRSGEEAALNMLAALVCAELKPVASTDIKAIELLFTNPDYANDLDELGKFGAIDVSHAIKALGASAAKEARVFAAAKSVPYFRALAVIWFRKAKKRRKPA